MNKRVELFYLINYLLLGIFTSLAMFVSIWFFIGFLVVVPAFEIISYEIKQVCYYIKCEKYVNDLKLSSFQIRIKKLFKL